MEKHVRLLVVLSAVQVASLLWLCAQSAARFPAVAHAGDTQAVSLVDHRLSRYQPLPVTVRNDDAIRVKCVD